MIGDSGLDRKVAGANSNDYEDNQNVRSLREEQVT